jgi:hypothetical protein
VEFASSIPVPEASGAVYVPARDGRPAELVVVGDSGNDGKAVILDPATGKVLSQARFPLDAAASDDVEGLAYADGLFYGLTSSGWMRHWRRTRDGFELARDAYPIAKASTGAVCANPRRSNCAYDYEGLCVAPAAAVAPPREGAPPPCVGFAASRARGSLICLVLRRDGALALDLDRAIPVARPSQLSGCDFDPDGTTVWAGTNVFGGSRVLAVRDWRDPARARVDGVGVLGSGFPETIAVAPGGVVYRFSDLRGSPSLANKYVCE